MPMYFKERDLQIFKTISQQLVQKVMQVEVLFFKNQPEVTQVNIYGQAKEGIRNFSQGIRVKCISQHYPHTLQLERNYQYIDTTRFKFLVSTLKSHNLYPQIGDVIGWSNTFWQVTLVTQQQLIGNQAMVEWSKICETTAISNSKTIKLLQLKSLT